MAVTSFRITNIECDACIRLSTKALTALPGVTHVQIDKESGVTAVHSDSMLAMEQISESLKKVGKYIEQLS